MIGLGFIRGRSLLVSWALAPILVGFLVSQYLPMFIGRYLLFVLPAWCLLVGAGVVGAAQLLGRVAERWRSRARTPVVAMVVAVVVALVALLGLDEQRALRQPASHLDNLRALTHDLAQSADPGDALVLVWTSSLPFFGAYGGPFPDDADLSLRLGPRSC
ncbi:hypothetical protein [Aeromicrobium sp. UC242_57]|uniref:hypothetical protein n=1 Tax=Aeromicrobium sp. UC242_57 TaxID=3374624 RepID=UPI0037A89542